MVISPFTLCVANRLSPTWLGTELMSICRAISVLVEQAKNTKAAATIKKAAAAYRELGAEIIYFTEHGKLKWVEKEEKKAGGDK